jgi:hypothetical protein
MVQLSATRCSCITILCVTLVSFAAIIICVASQQVIPKVSIHFVIDSVKKLLDTPLYIMCDTVNTGNYNGSYDCSRMIWDKLSNWFTGYLMALYQL